MPPKKPSKPPRPVKPNALTFYTLADLPPAEPKAGQLVAVTDDGGVLLNLALSDGAAWFSIPVTGELILPTPAPADPVPTDPVATTDGDA